MNVDVQNILTATLIGITIWLIKSFLQNHLTSKIDLTYGIVLKVQQELTDHMADCNEIPKSLILEKINNLLEKVNENHSYVKELRNDFKEETKTQQERYHSLANKLMINPHKNEEGD